VSAKVDDLKSQVLPDFSATQHTNGVGDIYLKKITDSGLKVPVAQ
jgi:hypothetical protein